MSNKPLQRNCETCRYRTVSVLIEPCQSCKLSPLPFGQGNHWRKRGWWQSPTTVVIVLAVLIAVAVISVTMIWRALVCAVDPAENTEKPEARQVEIWQVKEPMSDVSNLDT